jgi:predicted kinase
MIIITGLPCTGKTTLGVHIARSLSLPYLHKDGIKELLFDAIGWKDRAWSKRLSTASYSLLFYYAETLLAAGRSLIVEANFDAKNHTAKFLEIKRTFAYAPLQILCHAEGGVLRKRFEQRSLRGERHPGHLDAVLSKELESLLLGGRTAPLDLGGQLIEVDTTAFGRQNMVAVLETVRSVIEPE